MKNKLKIRYAVDVGLLISFLIVVVTGIMKFGKFLGMLGINPNYASMPMASISAWHNWSGLAMAALVLIHLGFNFRWLVSTTKCLFKKDKKCEVEDGKQI